MSISRVGKTSLVSVSYTSTSAKQSAQIANSYVDIYLADQLESKYEEVRRANSWLQARLEELRQQSMTSDLNVQRFRAENNLISVGGQLVSEQQLQELNTQQSTAQLDLGRAEARLQQIRSVIEKGPSEALVSDALDSQPIRDLRARFLDASKREADIAARVGKDHATAIRLRNEMSDYQRLIFEELSRIAQAYESDYQVAKSRLEGVNRSMRDQVSIATKANNKLVELRELEREAESYKVLYQAFLQRYQQTVQQQSFPISDARIVSAAAVPLQPSAPNSGLALAMAAVLGAMAGGAFGAFREYRDRAFRTAKQIRDELNLECLGVLPQIENSGGQSRDLRQTGSGQAEVIAPALLRYVLDAPVFRVRGDTSRCGARHGSAAAGA